MPIRTLSLQRTERSLPELPPALHGMLPPPAESADGTRDDGERPMAGDLASEAAGSLHRNSTAFAIAARAEPPAGAVATTTRPLQSAAIEGSDGRPVAAAPLPESASGAPPPSEVNDVGPAHVEPSPPAVLTRGGVSTPPAMRQPFPTGVVLACVAGVASAALLSAAIWRLAVALGDLAAAMSAASVGGGA